VLKIAQTTKDFFIGLFYFLLSALIVGTWKPFLPVGGWLVDGLMFINISCLPQL